MEYVSNFSIYVGQFRELFEIYTLYYVSTNYIYIFKFEEPFHNYRKI